MYFFPPRHSHKQKQLSKRQTLPLFLEPLEDRSLPSTFTVVNLNNGGTGTLRQAILDANANPGADSISFSVAGTVHLLTGALPAITGTTNIDGTTAPGYAGTPVVEIDYNHFGGLRFSAGSAGSALRSLAHNNATGSGVTLNGVGTVLVTGNYIGLKLNGTTVAGNSGSGLELYNSSDDTIGGTTTQTRNLIAGNQLHGISLTLSNRNQIAGNYIGTDRTGAVDLGNVGNGIYLTANSTRNSVTNNLISGNNANGVYIAGGSNQTTVSGNLIGLNASGSAGAGQQPRRRQNRKLRRQPDRQ